MEEQAKKKFIINIIFISLWVGLIFIAGKFLLQYLFPFVIAVLVATVMQKPAEKISRKSNFKKGICAAVLSAILYIGVAAVLVFVIFKIFKFTGTAISSLTALSQEASEFILQIQEIFSNVSSEIGEAGEKILTNMLSSVAERLSSFLSATAAEIVKTAPSFLFSSVVALAATCYIAKDFDGLINFVKGLINEKTVKNLGKVRIILKTCVFKMMTGYLILMLLTFFELLLGLLVLRVKNAILTALIIALIDVLPVLGAGAVLLPWGIVNIILGNTGFGIGIMILYLCITVIRNFAEPKIVGGKTGIAPLFILIAMFLGLRLFGFVGLIILPVTFIVVIKYYKSEMEQETS